MFRLLADENFNQKIVDGILKRVPVLDIVRAQDVGLSQASDFDVLEWAASNDRIVITHDSATLPPEAHERVRLGKPLPGVIEIAQHLPPRDAVDELHVLIECSEPSEWADRVVYLPIR
jgi:predicted nuclease of predicted toxin-antitoxin system